MLVSIHVYHFGNYNDRKTDKIVCSHKIFKILNEFHPHLHQSVKKETLLDYHQYGTFSIQDYARLHKADPTLFDLVPLYTPAELETLQTDRGSKATLTLQAVEKRGLSFIEKLLNCTTQIKLQELVAEYFLSVMLRDKAGMLVSRIFMMRAQIILLIGLIKVLRLALQIMD